MELWPQTQPPSFFIHCNHHGKARQSFTLWKGKLQLGVVTTCRNRTQYCVQKLLLSERQLNSVGKALVHNCTGLDESNLRFGVHVTHETINPSVQGHWISINEHIPEAPNAPEVVRR